MKRSNVEIGGVYTAKVSGKLTQVRILWESKSGPGWTAKNLKTGREIFIRSGQRLRERVEE